MSIGKPKRPVEPYSWNPEQMSEEMLEDWYGYIRALEGYTEYLEAMTGKDRKDETEPPREEKIFEICYHEVLGRTIYIRAEDRDEAKEKAESYFENNPLSYDDYIDSSMETNETLPGSVEDWEVTA